MLGSRVRVSYAPVFIVKNFGVYRDENSTKRSFVREFERKTVRTETRAKPERVRLAKAEVRTRQNAERTTGLSAKVFQDSEKPYGMSEENSGERQPKRRLRAQKP